MRVCVLHHDPPRCIWYSFHAVSLLAISSASLTLKASCTGARVCRMRQHASTRQQCSMGPVAVLCCLMSPPSHTLR